MPSSPAAPSTWSWCCRNVLPRFWLKVIIIPAGTALFFTAYVALLKHPRQPPFIMPTTAVDDWIGVSWLAVVLYASLWIYVSLPPALAPSFKALLGFAWRIGLLCALGLAIFFAWPTAVPAANVDWARYPGLAFLKGVDAAGNACPSLHVACALFSGWWLHLRLREVHGKRRWQTLNWIWCLAIVYSTLATKQHVWLDVVAGALLGAACALWLVRPALFRASPAVPAGQLQPP